MKYILIFLLIISGHVQAQDTLITPGSRGGWTNVNPGAYGTIQNRISIGKVFLFPTGCGDADSLWGYDLGQMALYGDSCSGDVWVYNPNGDTWSVLGSGGGVTIRDTAYLNAGFGTVILSPDLNDSLGFYAPNYSDRTIIVDTAALLNYFNNYYTNINNPPPDSSAFTYIVYSVDASPNLSYPDGTKVLIASSGTTGSFVGHENDIATLMGGVYTFTDAASGDQLLLSNDSDPDNPIVRSYRFDGTNWILTAIFVVVNGQQIGAPLPIGTNDSNNFVLKTNDTGRVTITPVGDVLINKYEGLENEPLFFKPGIDGKLDTGRFTIPEYDSPAIQDSIMYVDAGVIKYGTASGGGGGGTTTNALTFNNSGTGDASGTTFDGSAARTISSNTILPTQTGNSGKVLQTDGSNVSWQTAAGGSSDGADTTTILGNIYSNNNWSALTDFTSNGGTASWGTSGGRITVSGGTNSYAQSLDYNYTTALSFWSGALKFGVNAAPGATSAMALGIRSANSTNPLGLALRIDLSNTGTAGLLAIVNITGTTPTNLAVSTSAISFSNGDSILLYFERTRDVVSGYARNVTTNGAPVKVYYQFSAAYGTTMYLPNTGKFAIFPFSGNYLVDSLDIRSKEVKYANWGIMGTSKTTGYFAGSFPQGYAQLLSSNLKNFVNNSGAGDLATHGLARVPEITALGIENVILEYGANDVASLATFQTNYAALVSGLQAAGITVWHLSPIYETAFDLSAIYNWMKATYTSNFIDVWDVGGLSGALQADGVHITPYADSIVYNRILYTIQPKKVNTVNYISGSGVTPQIGYFTGANSLGASGINVDATNRRIGFGTTSPTHRITLDSATATNNGIALYKTADQTTNYGRLAMYQSGGGFYLTTEKGGTGTLSNLFLNSTTTRVQTDGSFVVTQAYITTATVSSIVTSPIVGTDRIQQSAGREMNVYAGAGSSSSNFGKGFFQHPTINESGTAGTSVFTVAPYLQGMGSGNYYISRFTRTSNAGGAFLQNDFLTVFPTGNVNIGDSVDRGSTFYDNGSFALKYTSTATSLTAGTHSTIEVTATGQTITLPTAVGVSGRIYTIVYTGASGTTTIATTSSQTFANITSAPTTLTLSAPAAGAITSYTVQSNGTNWVVTGKVKNE